MKTIKQIADDIGVSKQAIYDKIKKEPLSSSLKEFTLKLDNTLHYKLDGINLIKSAFNKKEQSSVSSKEPVKLNQVLTQTLQDQIAFLTEQNNDFRQQLNEERRHNREQADQILQLAVNSQKLEGMEKEIRAMKNSLPKLAEQQKKNLVSRLFLWRK